MKKILLTVPAIQPPHGNTPVAIDYLSHIRYIHSIN